MRQISRQFRCAAGVVVRLLEVGLLELGGAFVRAMVYTLLIRLIERGLKDVIHRRGHLAANSGDVIPRNALNLLQTFLHGREIRFHPIQVHIELPTPPLAP